MKLRKHTGIPPPEPERRREIEQVLGEALFEAEARDSVGPRERQARGSPRAHRQALCLPDLPRRHRHGPAGLRRRRLPLEYEFQLYFRRAKQLQLSWWDTRTLEELVASAVLDGASG